MIKKINLKQNLKSESGITMVDLIAAFTIFTIFTGILVSLMYSVYKVNMEMRLSGLAVNYSIQILEDIDKITYDEVTNGMEEIYREKFLIPDVYNLSIEVSDYNSGSENYVKRVKLTITYTLSGKEETTVINKLKVKEVQQS